MMNPNQETLQQVDLLKEISPSDASTIRAIRGARTVLTEAVADETIASDMAVECAKRGHDLKIGKPRDLFAKSRILGGIAFGGLAVSLAFVIWIVLSGPNSIAFAQVQQELKKVRTVRYNVVSENPDGSKELVITRYVISGNRLRADWPGNTQIKIPDQETILFLDHENRAAKIALGTGEGTDRYQWLATVAEASVKELGKSTIDGKAVVGFEVPEKGNSNMKVWIDPQTRLPVRIVATGNRVLQDFEFDREVRDELFKLDVPEGYFVERRYSNPPTRAITAVALAKYRSIVLDANRSAFQTVEAFLKLAAAGKLELVAKLQRNPSPDDLRELDGNLELRIEKVYSTDGNSLVVTSAAVSQREKKRGMVFTLRTIDGTWMIDDIDLESTEGIKDEVQRFLKKHPAAQEQELS